MKTNRKTQIRSFWLLAVVLTVVCLYLRPTFINAAEQTITVATSINLRSNGSATVKHTFSFKGGANSPSEASFSVLGSDIKGISAKDQTGAKLGIKLSDNDLDLLVSVPKDKQKTTKAWSFSVNYTTTALSDFGQAKVVQLPAFASNLPITGQTLRLAADLDLGFASVRGLAPSKTGVGIGQQLIDFTDKDSQLERSISIVFGNSTRAKVNLTTTIKNNSWWWKNVSLTLPPDTNQQKVSLNNLDPRPANVRLDRDGNILAVYRLAPLGQKEVKISVDVSLSALNYKLDNPLKIADTETLLIDRYTRLTDSWQPLGLELDINGETPANEAVKTIFEAVVDKVRNEDDIDQALILSERTAPLTYADWLVGELRSRSIPARVVLGLVFTDGERVVSQPRPSAWAEVYVNGTGWITLDPWLAAHSGLYGAADPQHLALGLWGLEDDRPPVPIEGASVEFTDETAPEPAEPSPSISAVKYVVLPFFSVMNIRASHGQNTIVDDIALQANNQVYSLGSVAPSGSVGQKLPVLGTRAFNGETVSLGQLSDEKFESWTETTAKVSYVPLIIEVGLVALFFIGRWVWQRRIGHTKKRFRPSKESLTLHDEATGGDVESENMFRPSSSTSRPNPVETSSEPKPPNRPLVQ